MLVRSTILMPSSAPGIFSLCREPYETATASTWRHRLWHCDAERGRKRWTCATRGAAAHTTTRHVSGLWPNGRTTYCDDGPWPSLPFAQLQLGNEDNKPVAKYERWMRSFWNNAEATAGHRRWLATSVARWQRRQQRKERREPVWAGHEHTVADD
jgi:hypothetical protein